VTPPPRSLFRYSLRALVPDYAGSGTGVVISLGLIGFVPLAWPVRWVATAAALLFLVYFGRTVCRQLTPIELDEAGIRARGPLGTVIRWENLRSLQLEYYSTRADREGGWMQLKLRDATRTIRIDSALDGFAGLAGRAAREASLRGLALDAATAANLKELLP
jgi:hypothetical protein